MKLYQVDAFAHEIFKGNPAAVCILPDDFQLSDKNNEQWMKNLAAEMNLSETAFVKKSAPNSNNTKNVKKGGDGYKAKKTSESFDLRWFTPKTEVDLCGHATLATAHILWQEGLLNKNHPALFNTRSGHLQASLNQSQITMDFPVDPIEKTKEPVGLEMALGCPVLGTYQAGQDLLVEVKDEQTVATLKPSFQQLSLIPVRCIIVSARGKKVDFVSRVFGPAVGINEDPVTGSTHCSLTPFWAERLQKKTMQALQLSQRGGALAVELKGERVAISGQAITVFKGEIFE